MTRSVTVAPLRRPRGGLQAPPTTSPGVYLLGSPANETNRLLTAAWRQAGIEADLVPARAARALLEPGDVVIGRMDVLRTLDGVEPGLLELFLLERAGFTVLNRAEAMLACHDKWRTALALDHAGLPHPRTTLLRRGGRCEMEPPLVVKPRFGSWGEDVERCLTRAEVALCLVRAATKPWFRRHGALIQELVPSVGVDLRIVVAGGRVVGAIERVARPGDWRTNTSLGGFRRPVDPPEDACALAISAADAVGADLVGVDLLPLGSGYSVIELNAAAEFTPEYGLGGDAYAAAAAALGLGPS